MSNLIVTFLTFHTTYTPHGTRERQSSVAEGRLRDRLACFMAFPMATWISDSLPYASRVLLRIFTPFP